MCLMKGALLNHLRSQRPKGDPLMNDCSISSEKLATFTLDFSRFKRPNLRSKTLGEVKNTLDSVIPNFQFSGTQLAFRFLWEEHAAVLTCDTSRTLMLKSQTTCFSADIFNIMNPQSAELRATNRQSKVFCSTN